METNTQSATAEKKPSGTHNTEVSSLLSVKQDLSRLDFSDSCNEGAEADSVADVMCDAGAATAAVTDSVEPVELTTDHEVHCEHLDDKLQPHKSRDHDHTATESYQFLDTMSGKVSLKRKSAECTSSLDDKRTSVTKKFKNKACAPDISASQLVRTCLLYTSPSPRDS